MKACDAVKKSEKRLRFTLDDGTVWTWQILSGIHKWYEPRSVARPDRHCEPAAWKMMGLESNGMLISAVHTEHGESACTSSWWMIPSRRARSC
ncbi:MAG: hypothetical protein ACLTYN_02520 [Dysosmobacter welbionis]